MITKEQYERWKDFAVRMAKTCFMNRRRPGWKEILSNVECFFDYLDPEDLKGIVDWDNSDPYPPESPYYRRTYRTLCRHCHGTKKPDCPHSCEDGKIYNYASPGYVGDMCSEMSENWNPYYWEDISDKEYQKRDEQFCSPVKCCIRAGLDMAVAPSEGVIGFTAGDIRKMYPQGVPDWITGGREHRWSYWLQDKLNGTFEEMPNKAQLVL